MSNSQNQSPVAEHDLVVLCGLWQHWTSLVEMFAQRSGPGRVVSDSEFHALHGELLSRCRSLAARSDEAQRAFFESLEELVHPWLSPEILDHTDREILLDLCTRCEVAEQKLGRRSWLSWMKRWSEPALIAAAVGIGLMLLGWAVHMAGPAFQNWVGDGLRRFRFGLRGVNESQWLAAAGVMVILVVVVMVIRVARRL